MERPSIVTIDSSYLDDLKKKALAWDELLKELGEIHVASIESDMDNFLSLGDKIDITRAVPIGQTIIVTNLPPTVGGAELMYSFLAPGGIRYYKLFFESKDNTHYLTALVTFMTSDAAEKYLAYISKCGVFFVSEKLREGHNESRGTGEFLKTSFNQKFQFLLKPCPDVTVSPWSGVERIAGKLITGDEGGYCNVSQAINLGATRVLIISPGIEAKELHEELRHLVAVPELRIELNRLLPALPPSKEMVTIIRFCSVRDAVMVKSYLSFLKRFSGPGGRMVRYYKDPTDRLTEELGWHALENPKKENSPLASIDFNLDASDVNPESKASIAPAAEADTLQYLSDTGDSDAESDMRELSFTLAKEAFLPHIPTSPNRACFTTLCHTPAPGDHTPAAPPEPEPQPEYSVNQENYYMSEEKPRLVALNTDNSVGVSVVVTNVDLSSKPDDTARRPIYPHEIYLSQGRAAGKRAASVLKNTGSLGTVGGMGKLKNAVSSPDLSWAKDADRLPPNVKTTNDGSPQLAIESVEPSLTGHEATLQKLRKEEAMLLSMQKVVVAADHLKVELEKSTGRLELEKQALDVVNLNQSQDDIFKGGEDSWKGQPTKKPSAPINDNFLGEWEDDF